MNDLIIDHQWALFASYSNQYSPEVENMEEDGVSVDV